MEKHLFRSLMFVPAHNERLMNSACRTKADVLLLDIEDSVQPVENKQVARDNILRYISEGRFEGRALYPRINDRESGELLKDVYQLTVPGIEGFGNLHGGLTGHGVGNEENFLRLHRGLEGFQLLHERFVHMQTAGGVEDEHGSLLGAGFLKSRAGNIHRRHGRGGGIAGHVELLRQHGELIDGRGPIHVGRHQIRPHLALAQEIGNFPGRRGLTRTLKAHQHDDGGFLPLQIQLGGLAAQERNQLVVHDLDDLLRGADALDDFLSEAFAAHILHKVLNDLEINVGFQERETHLAQAGLNVFLGQLALSAQIAEGGRKSVGKIFEHDSPTALPRRA